METITTIQWKPTVTKDWKCQTTASKRKPFWSGVLVLVGVCRSGCQERRSPIYSGAIRACVVGRFGRTTPAQTYILSLLAPIDSEKSKLTVCFQATLMQVLVLHVVLFQHLIVIFYSSCPVCQVHYKAGLLYGLFIRLRRPFVTWL